ncbi:MAG: hypothetical protein GFH27_549297n143 [Chloroflexi bacterium AL-W]|nr:hypothetical protein [Chloroflexi bacterium AL-N1]NOK69003.1 hypothetical protein [Chloroflexi bacterium AL-N10]NOK76986.1 hypothetical protein [Chloroflexi bacterium AL-N5]NOK82626.1 hypothetical protein [Chloroflexi bacterium AL-W]NOK90843.1 hypothetical protein [Chloroflexi bacterium AL-N15]
MRQIWPAVHYVYQYFTLEEYTHMDAKNVIYGETGLDQLVQQLRAFGKPLEISELTQHYLTILRNLVLDEEQPSTDIEAGTANE